MSVEDQLQAAMCTLSDEMDSLDADYWLWGAVPENTHYFKDTAVGLGLFYRSAKGRLRSSPIFYLFFDADNVHFQWSAIDNQRKTVCRSFACATDALMAVLVMARAYQPNDNSCSNQALLGFTEAVLGSQRGYVHPDKPRGAVDLSLSPESPFNDPVPVIVFEGKLFVLTGQFVRAKSVLHQAIRDLGGLVSEDLSYRCDYLIVADKGSDTWAHGSYGRKIDKAVDIRRQGYQLAIVTEGYFLSFIA